MVNSTLETFGEKVAHLESFQGESPLELCDHERLKIDASH